MAMKALFDAIYSRFTALTGGVHNSFYTAIGGRLHAGAPCSNTSYPFAVFSFVSGFPDWTFTDQYEDAIIQFSLFDQSSSPATVLTNYGYLDALYHDCTLTVTGYSCVYMWRDTQHLLRDEDDKTWHCVAQYRVYLQKS